MMNLMNERHPRVIMSGHLAPETRFRLVVEGPFGIGELHWLIAYIDLLKIILKPQQAKTEAPTELNSPISGV